MLPSELSGARGARGTRGRDVALLVIGRGHGLGPRRRPTGPCLGRRLQAQDAPKAKGCRGQMRFRMRCWISLGAAVSEGGPRMNMSSIGVCLCCLLDSRLRRPRWPPEVARLGPQARASIPTGPAGAARRRRCAGLPRAFPRAKCLSRPASQADASVRASGYAASAGARMSWSSICWTSRVGRRLYPRASP